ncbi:tautomerase family protein [Paenirhodobacter populi]|uniref:Tautomerase family protein n=1 Tax=Paenirhodobacter populi TaxID=2306993 RepID=A0A443K836_9RHOB|nr:tautomerase family protein [Sinirhodobacter populi]RWR24397.1 tautomerase family protein [Sinirhodobacter populi]RWR28892.1 tautomerase family protein [Sinirhodobacter populi]
MPLMQYHVIKGRTPEQIALLLDTAHDAMVRSFGVPEGDRYQTLQEYEPSHLKALDTGLGIPRTENFVLLHVVSRPRGKEAKQEFYRNLCDDLQAKCGIAPSDVMISFTENSDEDWSFGYGRAQFLTGEL